MELINQLLAFAYSHKFEVILSVALGISEALAAIPQVQSNSIYQLVSGSLKKIKDKLFPKKPDLNVVK